MDYRMLGGTGLSVSSLSYGASPLGGVFGSVDDAEGIACVHAALDAGINLIDVSPFYGETVAETRLGKALRGIDRERYYLSTKVGRYGAGVFDFSADRVRRSVDESLGRLGIAHVDLLLCHDIEFGSLDQIVDETLPALREIVQMGKARFIGITGLPLAIFPRVLDRAPADVILSYCHYTLTDSSLDTLLPYLAGKGVGVINASPLGMGLLGDGPLPDWHPAPPILREAVALAGAACRAHGTNLADLAVAWSVSRPDIATTIVGSARADEIRRNVLAAERVPDPALLAEVRTILQPVRDLTWPSGRAENDPEALRGLTPRPPSLPLRYREGGASQENPGVISEGRDPIIPPLPWSEERAPSRPCEAVGKGAGGLGETILQFGAGRVVVVQSTPGGRAALLNAQGGRFHVVVRGRENGAPIERVQEIESISRALVAQTDWDAVLDVARSPDLRAIVSNTTEAGLVLDDADADGLPATGSPVSFPAKILSVLHARFEAGLPGLTILPCELIEANGDRLRDLVLEQAARGGATAPAFHSYLTDGCGWINSLVDRIVSGKPGAHPLLAEDPLLTVTEPYEFWAVENKPGTEWLQHPAIRLTTDVGPYALRKVRILNGAHTALVARVRQTGRADLAFVREAVADPALGTWLRGLLFDEIVPAIEDRAPDARAFAEQTLERFANPFLDHKLSDIALHHDTKIGVRLVPTASDYRAKFGRDPGRLTEILHG
jgi:L-galactose dehydrogenase